MSLGNDAADPESDPGTLGRVEVKHGSKVAFDFRWSESLTIGDLRRFTAEECGVELDKLSLIYKGKKLQGIAFPSDTRLGDVEQKPPQPGKTLVIQAMGSRDTRSGGNALRDIATQVASLYGSLRSKTEAASKLLPEVDLGGLLPAAPEAMQGLRRGAGGSSAGEKEQEPQLVLDMLTITSFSTRLDSLDELSDAQRQVRRQVLKMLELLETTIS
ncbi:unnamed protein product [Amoebophrya sp. A120]|nr:unnamed protein product [Amoebophrya sp. A120]|eukprot:GSA120T00021646001.1